jgi:hypothetical protein
MGHALMENRNGLAILGGVSQVDPRDLLVPFPEDQLAIKPQPSRR